MKEYVVQAEKRSEKGKGHAHKLRFRGFIPGILYGRGLANQPLTLEPGSITDILRSETGFNSLLKLKISGEDVPESAMIKDYQVDPVTHELVHVDFIRIAMDKKIDVEIPIELTGTAKGVKEGGLLDFMHRQMAIRCLPSMIPDHVKIDISNLQIGDHVKILDIVLPEGVESREEPERVVAVVMMPRIEKVEVPVAAAAEAEVAEPEVVKKGKVAAEGEEEKTKEKAKEAKGKEEKE
jgi:large subunit ribosomal protein L25